MEIKFYSQAAPEWAQAILGRSKNFRQAGCAVTSCAVLLSQYGSVTPKELDSFLDKNGGYVGDSVVWEVVLKFGVQKGFFKKGYVTHDYDISNFENAETPCIMAVKTPRGTTHFVVLLDYKMGRIHDPASIGGANTLFRVKGYKPTRIIELKVSE